jgi:hypothetical protein
MSAKVQVELTAQELKLIILGMTSGQYPQQHQQEAFNLVLRLRDKLRETT